MKSIVYVTAPWCAPCRAFAPVIKEVEIERPDIKIQKVDAEADSEKVLDLAVKSVPTFILFNDGKEISRHIGKMTKAEFLKWLDK